MTTDYDTISDQYRSAKEQPWRSRVEAHSMMQLIGDVRGKNVVDLACGEGFFTRKLKRAGPARAVGIDISRQMIALARGHEKADPTGAEYFVEDARATGSHGEFDLAVSAWLLVYAHDRSELAIMCRGIASRLKSGGRFVTLTSNPALFSFERKPNYRKYGFDVDLAEPVREGAQILWTIHLDDETSFAIENYYLPVEALVSSLADAGMRNVAVHSLTLGPDPAAGDEGEYWAEILEYPPAIMIDGIKG
jgi:SAM-dependent methyltransferase